MIRVQLICIFVLLLGVGRGNAQHIKHFRDLDTEPSVKELREVAQQLMADNNYYAAIHSLEQIVQQDPDINYRKMLADAYYNVGCYADAQKYYLEYINAESDSSFPVVDYNLGVINVGLEQYDSAQYWFTKCKQSSSDSLLSAKADRQIQLCEQAETLKGVAKNTEIALNSEDSVVGIYSLNGYSIYTKTKKLYVPRKQKLKQGVILLSDTTVVTRLYTKQEGLFYELGFNFSDDINLGAPSLNSDGTTLYFTACNKQGDCKIYESNKVDGEWHTPVALNEKINVPEYSSKYPSVVALENGGSLLFYSSNRPGGFGGMDIWYAQLSEETYDSAINLGSGINTDEDEITPFFDMSSGSLFFSSKGHVSKGGFDVFMAKPTWSYGYGRVYNIGQPLNSGMDDFYFSLVDGDPEGYLTSNRGGCMDRTYNIHFEVPFAYNRLPQYLEEVNSFSINDTPLELINEHFQYSLLELKGPTVDFMVADDAVISGHIFDAEEDKSGHKVMLLDEAGSVIDVAVTDKNGDFEFRKLPNGGAYTLVLSEEDAGMNASLKVSTNDEQHSFSRNEHEEVFNYRKLTEYESEYFYISESDAAINGNIGQFDGASGHKVYLVDDNGKVVDIAEVDENGDFKFRRLPEAGNYAMVLEAEDSNMNIAFSMFDSDGEITNHVNKDLQAAAFHYRKLEDYNDRYFVLEEEDEQIQGNLFLTGEETRKLKHKILLKDVNGRTVAHAYTDADGNFIFRKLPAAGKYYFELSENDAAMEVDVVVLNGNNHLTQRIGSTTRNKVFRYTKPQERRVMVAQEPDKTDTFTEDSVRVTNGTAMVNNAVATTSQTNELHLEEDKNEIKDEDTRGSAFDNCGIYCFIAVAVIFIFIMYLRRKRKKENNS